MYPAFNTQKILKTETPGLSLSSWSERVDDLLPGSFRSAPQFSQDASQVAKLLI